MTYKLPLEGIRVVEYASFVAGPYCAKLLGELGAVVVKVEPPGTGDESRRRGPFQGDIPHPERSGLFAYLNMAKKSVTLNLDSLDGQRTFRRLIEKADVLLEDRRPGFLEDRGLNYSHLSKVNPQLIQTSITPFGQTGPYRDYKAYYLNTFHVGGEGYITPGGTGWLLYPDREPIKLGGYIGEYESGLVAAVATLGAIYKKLVAGIGQFVEISKQEVLLSSERYDLTLYNTGWVESRASRNFSVAGLLQCQDGFVEIIPMEKHMYDGLMLAIGKSEWIEQERYCWKTITMGLTGGEKAPAEDRRLVNDAIEVWALERTKKQIYDELQANRCPVGVFRTCEDLLKSEQYNARQFFVEVDHPYLGRVKYPSTPFKYSCMSPRLDRAPLLGENNEELLCGELGYAKDDLIQMRGAGVI